MKESEISEAAFKITQFDPEAYIDQRHPGGRLIYDEVLNQKDYARHNYHTQMTSSMDVNPMKNYQEPNSIIRKHY